MVSGMGRARRCPIRLTCRSRTLILTVSEYLRTTGDIASRQHLQPSPRIRDRDLQVVLSHYGNPLRRTARRVQRTLSQDPTVDRYPEHLFVPLTPPPLRATRTRPDQARRARAFARWMMSAKFHQNRLNVIPYDLFDALATAEDDAVPNVLRPEYCRRMWLDSHPNLRADRAVAPGSAYGPSWPPPLPCRGAPVGSPCALRSRTGGKADEFLRLPVSRCGAGVACRNLRHHHRYVRTVEAVDSKVSPRR